MTERDVGRIQITQSLSFLKKEWRIQRMGWIVFALIMLLGLLGVFGRGAYSSRHAGDSRLRIDYERVLRHGAVSDLTVTVGPQPATDSSFRLYVSADYLGKFEIADILPAPVRSGFRGDFAYFDFTRTDARHDGRVVIHMTPTGYWGVDAAIAAEGSAPIRIKQFILP